MKRLLKIFGVLVVLIIAAAIILPMVLKDEIMAAAKAEINNTVNAKVEFEDIDLSLFKSFPNFWLGIENLTVDGVGIFEGTRLAEIGLIDVDLDLFSVISGNHFSVESIRLIDTKVHVVIDTSGAANYDIMKPSEEAEADDEAPTAETSDFKFSLRRYAVENFNLIYDDQQGHMYVSIIDLDHTGTGDFTSDIVNLETTTSIEALSFDMDGIGYLTKAKADAKINLELNQPEFKFTFAENEVMLNEVLLNFKGFVAMPAEDISMDLSFDAPNTDFKSLLSLIPAIYYQDYSDVKTTGSFSFNGNVNGVYSDDPETYPAFDIKFDVNNATFRYPDLPAGVDDINVKAHIYNKSSDLDHMVVDIAQMKAVIAQSPILTSLLLKTPMSDPEIGLGVTMDFDLANIAKVIPSEGQEYQGNVKANLDVYTKMSYIDNEQYDRVKAEGSLLVSNIVLKSDSLPYDVKIATTDMKFSPQYISLDAFEAQIGASDISASGRIDNLLAYVLQDKTLEANFNLSSNLLDLNELSGPSEEPTTAAETESAATDTSALEIIRIPQNISAGLAVNFKKVQYDNLELTDVKGLLKVHEGKADLNQVGMNLLGGSMTMDGAYDSKPEVPAVNMDLNIVDFDFKQSFEKLTTVQKLAPIMESTTGSYSTALNFKSDLGVDMMPVLNTLQAKGRLKSKQITTSPTSLKKLADIIKNPKLEKLELKDLNLSYEIKDGRIEVEPFEIKSGDVSAMVSGTSGLDKTLDYDMDMKIPVSGIKAEALLSKLGATKDGKMDLKVMIGGTYDNPKVTTDAGSIVSNVVDNIKDKVNEEIDKAKQEAKEKLLAEAEKQGNALIAEAEKQGNVLRAAAKQQADKLRAETKKQADKTIAEAGSNPIKKTLAEKLAKEMEQSAANTAAKIEKEADDKANALVQVATDQKQKLVAEAQAKANQL